MAVDEAAWRWQIGVDPHCVPSEREGPSFSLTWNASSLVLRETYASSTLLDRLEFAWLLTKQHGDGRLELTRIAFQVKEKVLPCL